MSKLGRRKLLRGLGLGLLAGAAARLPMNRAFADPGTGTVLPPTSAWGALPTTYRFARNYKVLEIYLSNGFSPWETFWVTEPGGAPAADGFVRNWAGLHQQMAALRWSSTAGANRPRDGAIDVQRFSVRGAGGPPVYFGPATKPLWRADILRRTRLTVLNHYLPPHQAAKPYAITGQFLGRPSMAGLGAPIQRYWYERSTGARRLLPFSYVLADTILNFTEPTEIGTHPGYSKPVLLDPLRLDAVARASSLNANSDALSAIYANQYQEQLTSYGATARSTALADYLAAAAMVPNTPALARLLAGRAPTLPPLRTPLLSHVVNCPSRGGYSDTTASLRLAAYLLTRPGAETARYVCVLDSGMSGVHYDTHVGKDNVRITSASMYNLLSELASWISDPASPDANKINLDDTLIILNTEFGRTPSTAGGPPSEDPIASHSGREHWTTGYVTLFIGGPTVGPNPSTGAGGISGNLDAEGNAIPNRMGSSPFYGPPDTRAATLMAAGIDPFAEGAFAIGDMSSAILAGDPRANLKNQLFLGV